jgi:hypothetical protein
LHDKALTSEMDVLTTVYRKMSSVHAAQQVQDAVIAFQILFCLDVNCHGKRRQNHQIARATFGTDPESKYRQHELWNLTYQLYPFALAAQDTFHTLAQIRQTHLPRLGAAASFDLTVLEESHCTQRSSRVVGFTSDGDTLPLTTMRTGSSAFRSRVNR